MLTDSGGCATRSEVNSYLSAQTVLAESPESAALLGHAKGDKSVDRFFIRSQGKRNKR
jgi:hypothetical protein